MSDDLITWLRAQLDWAEVDASEDHTLGCKVHDIDEDVDLTFTNPDACDCPVRPRLLDVDAKRRILAFHQAYSCADCNGQRLIDDDSLSRCTLIRLLALPYADRPGYRDEWRP